MWPGNRVASVPLATVDLTPLTDPPAEGERTFTWMPGERSSVYVANVFIGVVGAFAIIFAVVGIAQSVVRDAPKTAIGYAVLGAIAAVVILGAIVRAVVRRRRYGVTAVELGPRLPRFAEANGWRFDREAKDGDAPGIRVPIVEPGPDVNAVTRRVTGRIRSDDGEQANPEPAPGTFELGDFFWTVDHGGGPKGVGTYTVAYLAVRLPRAVPLLALVSTTPGAGELLAHADQTLKLEGDWGKHFTLYCPAGYERDALQIMTPDVMAAMIDGAAAWSAVTRDRWLVFVSQQVFARARPDQYSQALQLVDVARQFHEQAEHYSDGRVSDRASDVVAHPGRTLRGSWNPLPAIAIGAPLAMIIAFILVPVVTGGG
jgi:hypothetical protein